MSKYYNNDRKMEYLEIQRIDVKENNVKNIVSVFNMTTKFENINDKDLCDFTFDELLALFNLNQWASFSTFKSKKTIITNYIKYCISNNLCYGNNLREITRLSHGDIKNKSKFEVEYYKDFDDFHSTVQNSFNDGGQQYESTMGDIGILYLLWYGCTKEEIVEIKNKDFDSSSRMITCTQTGRTICIDNDKVLNLFTQLKNITTAKQWNSAWGKWRDIDYKNIEYLIKSIRSDKLTPSSIKIRVSKLNRIIKENINMEDKYANKRITDVGISTSGLYSKIKALEDDKNIKLTSHNVSIFNEVLNTNITEVVKGGAYDFEKNYNEWKNFFYGE